MKPGALQSKIAPRGQVVSLATKGLLDRRVRPCPAARGIGVVLHGRPYSTFLSVLRGVRRDAGRPGVGSLRKFVLLAAE